MTKNNLDKAKTKRPSLKSEILKVAEEEFLEKNYRGVSIDEIVEKAGVTKRTFYKYFPSKLALFIHVFEVYLSKLKKELLTKSRAVSAQKEIEQHYRKLFRFTQKNEKFMRLYWMMDSSEFEGEIPPELICQVQRLTDEMFKTSLDIFNRAKASGEIINIDTFLLVHLLSAINKGIFIHASKEKRFEIAKINQSELLSLLFVILEQGLFTKPTGGDTP